MLYPVALVYQGRYIDFELVDCDNIEQAINLIRKSIKPDFERKVGCCAWSGYETHEELPVGFWDDMTAHYPDFCNDVDKTNSFVVKWFMS